MADSETSPPRTTPPGHDPGAPDPLDLAPEAARLHLIAGALAASVVVYAGIAWFLTSEAMAAGFAPAGLPASVAIALAVGGIALLVAAPLAEGRIRASGAGGTPGAAVSAFRTATLVGFALREAGALCGLLIAILTGDPFWCFGLCLAALIAMSLSWPTRQKLEAAVRGAVAPT